MTCEKCWRDACFVALTSGRSEGEEYHRLLEERKDKPCSPREQAGQFWGEAIQADTRNRG